MYNDLGIAEAASMVVGDMETKQKTFRLPVRLIAIWQSKFNPGGAKISSHHATAAVMLYCSVPEYVRFLAQEAAKIEDPEEAKEWLRSRLKSPYEQDEAAILKGLGAAIEGRVAPPVSQPGSKDRKNSKSA